jgi:type IV pilus modification protein PilV
VEKNMKAFNKTKYCVGGNKARGFMLVELMIALLVLTIGILGMMSMQIKGIQTNSSARRITQSAAIGADRFEKLMGLPYDTSDFEDDLLAPNSDHSLVDGRYTIRWTVSAENTPIPNVKTINVSVSTQEAGQERSITYVYYKADKI